MLFFFFKQKTAYEMRISDWSSDVCSSDLIVVALLSALMIALGVWQLQRGFAKQKLLDRYQQASSVAPVPLSAGHVAREDEIERAVAQIGRASCRERVCQYV